MNEGLALALFAIVALAGITALVYPAISGSMTVSPCNPLPTPAAVPPATKYVVPKSSIGRTSDRSFFIDESGVIRVNPCPPTATPSDSPLNN